MSIRRGREELLNFFIVVGIEFFCAFGAYAVGKIGVGTVSDIYFYLFPISLVIADFLAIRAYGHHPA